MSIARAGHAVIRDYYGCRGPVAAGDAGVGPSTIKRNEVRCPWIERDVQAFRGERAAVALEPAPVQHVRQLPGTAREVSRWEAHARLRGFVGEVDDDEVA